MNCNIFRVQLANNFHIFLHIRQCLLWKPCYEIHIDDRKAHTAAAGKHGKYILNPVLEETSGEQYGDEGCLSLPGLWYKTPRADYARVRGIDLDGNEVVLEGSGLMGRMLQHETDHLDGHVYIDRLEKEERRQAMHYLRTHAA